jgi:hypothetical protein
MSSRAAKLFMTGLLATSALAIGGCGPDYALFKIHMKSAGVAADRDAIEECRLSITTGSGEAVLTDYILPSEVNADNQLIYGCRGGMTHSTIGDFSYSTSRSGGTLIFTLNGVDNTGTKVIQKESVTSEVKKYPPEIELTLTIK